MKKISIVLAILAVFLVFSCSNAAGAVDTAGNPVDLAGSWSGSVAYKSAVKYDLPAAVMGTIVSGEVVSYTDYVGTWVSESYSLPAKDYTLTKTESGTTVTAKYIYTAPATTTTTTREIASDGSYVETIVKKTEYFARDAVGASANKVYYINDFGPYNSCGAYLGGVLVETTVNKVSAAKQDDGQYTITTETKYDYVESGKYYGDSPTSKSKTQTKVQKDQGSYSFIPNGYEHKVKSARKPVEYLNDITENITFEVAKDGTYTMKSVIVETQAAAAAAAATDTAYAAAERKAATKTTTSTSKGTVAAWTTTTANNGESSGMALSANALTSETVGTENFEGDTKTATVTKLDSGEYTIRILKGAGDAKKETVLTRLYITKPYSYSNTDTDPVDNYVIVFNKAVEAAK